MMTLTTNPYWTHTAKSEGKTCSIKMKPLSSIYT